MRNPYMDEQEEKMVKEAIPYGNPFKKILRSRAQKLDDEYNISDEAYLTSMNDAESVALVKRDNSSIEDNTSNATTISQVMLEAEKQELQLLHGNLSRNRNLAKLLQNIDLSGILLESVHN